MHSTEVSVTSEGRQHCQNTYVTVIFLCATVPQIIWSQKQIPCINLVGVS